MESFESLAYEHHPKGGFMKKLAFFILVATQAAFGLSGVLQSKQLGSLNLSVDYTAVRVIPVAMTTEISTESDTREQSCVSSLSFLNVAQAVYFLEKTQVLESQHLIAGQDHYPIISDQKCVSPTRLVNTANLFLAKGGDPEFVLSRSAANGESKKLSVFLSFPRQMATGEVFETTPGFFSIRNLAFGQKPVVVNFSVVETTILADGRPSWSYLEHGTVELK